MAVNIQMKTDYSYLFSGLGSVGMGGNAGGINNNFLSDYASIKNGSYLKLMKAYYNGSANESVKKLASDKVTKDESQKLTKVQTATDALKESADALMATGKNSLFNKAEVIAKDEFGNETASMEYDTDKIYKAVDSFVKNFNSVIDAVDGAGNEKISDRAVTMANNVIANLKSLNKLGITIDKDMKLFVDKEEFMKADMDSAKLLFNGVGSFAYQISAQSSMIDYAAERAGSGMYNGAGRFQSSYNTGSLFDSIF